MPSLRWLCLFGALSGCSPTTTSTVPANEPFHPSSGLTWVREPNVRGPHGESLVDIQCGTLSDCMGLARSVCHGDFDVVTTLALEMLVRCAAAPAGGAALPTPDGGA